MEVPLHPSPDTGFALSCRTEVALLTVLRNRALDSKIAVNICGHRHSSRLVCWIAELSAHQLLLSAIYF